MIEDLQKNKELKNLEEVKRQVSLNRLKFSIRNSIDYLKQYQIRINGYLYKLVMLSAGQERKISFPRLGSGYQVTVHEVEEDINMTLPENAIYYNRAFFKTLAVDDVVDWRYDDGTLEVDKVPHP